MSSFFNFKEDRREFKYKPRFQKQESDAEKGNGEFDPNKFGERLHRSWSSKRRSRPKNSFPMGLVLLLLGIFVIILFFYFKFVV